MGSPPPEIRELVREVYPLVLNRRYAKVPILAFVHRQLTEFAERTSRHPEEWPDMALRVMLEFERNGH